MRPTSEFLARPRGQTIGDDYSMLKKNVKFRKRIEEKVAFGVKRQLDFGLNCPECTEMADEEVEKVLMQVLLV